MYKFETLTNQNSLREHRAIVSDKGHVQVQNRPMARNYRITQPSEIYNRLAAEGFDLDLRLPDRIMKGRKGWNQALVVAERAGAYSRVATIHLNHTGRHSIQIMPRALRMSCTNVFDASPIRIRHTDPEADHFLADPGHYVRLAWEIAETWSRRIELLRDYGDAWPVYNALREHKPRLWGNMRRYAASYPSDNWGLLQALTEPKRPGLQRLAAVAMQKDYEALSNGDTPVELLAAILN